MANHYNVRVVTPPIGPVLTLNEVKLHLKVDTSADDELIQNLIVAVQDDAEKYCNRRFRTQSLEARLDNFWHWYKVHANAHYPWYQWVEPPYPPCQSVTDIQYIDFTGVLQTLDTSIYIVDTVAEPCRIYHAYNQAFPITRTVPNAVLIHYVAGYPDDNSGNPTCPQLIKQGMLMTIEHLYRHRGEVSDTNLFHTPMGAQRCYDKYRIMDV